MSKKCGQVGQIDRRRKNGRIQCHKTKRLVQIMVDEDHGNKCLDQDCKYSPAYVKKD